MTTTAITRIFELPVLVSVFVAASIELVGINVNSRYLEAKTFNDDLETYKARYKSATYRYPRENEDGARSRLVWFYIITGCIVAFTAFYEVFVEKAVPIKLLACLFPVTSAIGTLVANERAAFRRKIATLQANENQPKFDIKQESNKENEIKIANPEEKEKEIPVANYATMETVPAIIALYEENPLNTQRKVAKAVGVTPQRVGQVLKQLEQAGQIRRNGHGVEVLQ